MRITQKDSIEPQILRKEKKKPNSPGQLLKHYSPKTPMKVNVNLPLLGDAFLNFGNSIPKFHHPTLNLSQSSDLNLSECVSAGHVPYSF